MRADGRLSYPCGNGISPRIEALAGSQISVSAGWSIAASRRAASAPVPTLQACSFSSPITIPRVEACSASSRSAMTMLSKHRSGAVVRQ